MATVDPGYAAYLKSAARYAGATIAGAVAQWADKALDSSVISPLAYQADAQNEAIAQAQFLAGPLARDKVVVKGLQKNLIGNVVTIYGDRLGYEAGSLAFVIGAAEAEAGRTTELTVLKQL